MEFLKQNKQHQRKMERFILLFYSIYAVNLLISVIRGGCRAWIPVCMLTAAAVSWILFLSKYKNYRTRAVLTTIMIQLTVVLYVANSENLLTVIPTVTALIVLAAFYGLGRPLGITLFSILFMVFYHVIITDTIRSLSSEHLLQLLCQLGNIFCVEFMFYIWLRNKDEDESRIYEIVEALMEAEQSKNDFLANVSHEIRTPVNTVCGMSELSLRESDMEKVRENILDIRDAGHNLMLLVSDILDFSRLQQGKMSMEEEAYQITSMINDVINMAMARKGEKKIELLVDCAADLPAMLLGDEQKIRRVILNLVDNAIKFTNEGGVLIDIGCRRESYGINLCISIKDTGIGIREENLERLFESFSQVDTRRNRKKGGMGLGLAISKELVLKMGGTITARSRLGKGSIFRFVIPQKILKEETIGQIENQEKLYAVVYFDMEQFDKMIIRDEYSAQISHMMEQLHVKYHICRNLAELKRRESYADFTHVFIGLKEYWEDEAYFDKLAEHSRIILVIERMEEKYISNPALLRLYKPFYLLPAVSILNGSRGSESGRRMVRPGRFTTRGVKVLAVDDNVMNIRVIEGLLKEYQIEVTYAASGQEALKLIEQMCYDFVFMDHMMPEMDGVETMHRIRNKTGQYYQSVPIIALTANAAPGSREKFLKEGFSDFIAKPVEISVLERVLRRNLPEQKLITQKDLIKEDTGIEKEAEGAAPASQELVIGELDVKRGLIYCGGKQGYLNILRLCVEESNENGRLLDQLYENRDWKNYIVKVHALKSTMKNIGAHALSQEAEKLELAGKREDIEYIENYHAGMLEAYRRLMGELAQDPQIQPVQEEAEVYFDETMDEKLPELDEGAFEAMLAELEDAMYSLDGEQMLSILDHMQEYQYCQASLKEKLIPVRKKIEMFDYMPAVEMLSKIHSSLLEGKVEQHD